MKQILLLILGFLVFLETDGQSIDVKFSGNYKDVPFNEFVTDIYNKTGISVFYSSDITINVKVTLQVDNITAFEAVSLVTAMQNLNLTIWNGSIVITENPISEVSLPQLTDKNSIIKESTSSETITTQTEQKYLTGKRIGAEETIIIGSKAQGIKGNKVKVKGVIRDSEKGEVLVGATMYIQETGTGASTNANGIVTIYLEPGVYNTRFDCIGQKSANYFLKILSDGEFDVSLDNSVLQIEEVFVYGDKSANIISRDAGLEKIAIKTLKELPMMMGESDVIKASELLPGIVAVGEGASGINVRGGNFDQNGFYLNKVPVYNTTHVFGFFPAFNPDIIKDFSIYKGHIPAEYGGRISSVFNIITKQGNLKRFNVRGGINPITSNITIEGPIVKEKGSALMSIRTSYSDWILSRIKDPDIRNSNAKFSDFVFSSTLNAGPKDQLNLFAYYSSDNFKFSNMSKYKYSNLGSSAEWRHVFNPSTRFDFNLIFSQYAFSTIEQSIPAVAYEHSYKISHYEIKSNFWRLINEKNKFETGVSLIGYNLSKGKVIPFTENSLREPVNLGVENGFEGTLYASDSYEPFPWLNIYLGLRYSTFAPLGEKDVLTYLPEQPKDPRYVMGSIHFNRLEPIKWYHGPEVRALINIKTDGNGSIKLSYNQNRQNLFMLNNTVTIAPNTQWKLADYYLKPSVGQQLSIGIFRNLPKYNFEISAELFAKKTENLSEFKDGASFIQSPNIEMMVLQGTQQAYGVELMAKKTAGRLNGWLAYTYSKSIIEVNGEDFWDKINHGKAYPSNYDIPHVVNCVVNYRFSRRFNLSTAATYQQGRPITYPLSVYYVNSLPVIEYSSRNEFRIPDYFRLDMSLAVEGNLKKRKLFHSSWVFGVYNVTGRKNPLSIFFKSENGKLNGYKYSIIGTPVFTATWVFKLGNYAAE